MTDEVEQSRRTEDGYHSDDPGDADREEMTTTFFDQSDVPFVGSAADYDALPDEQKAMVDGWAGDDFVDKLRDFEARQQQNRNLYGPGYWD